MTTLQTLLSQQATLNEQIETLRRNEHADGIKRVRGLMAEYGLSLQDIGAGAPRSKSTAGTAGTTGTAGTKVAAKYRDASSGDTWSGRGLTPKWLKAKMQQGQKIEEFAV